MRTDTITCCLIDGTTELHPEQISIATRQLVLAYDAIRNIKEVVWLSAIEVPPYLQHSCIRYINIPQLSYQTYQTFSIMNLPDICYNDFLLTCQLDGIPYDISKWDDHFLEYDYIGALLEPEQLQASLDYWGAKKNILHNNHYWCCNSGFCLRSKRLLSKARELKLYQRYGELHTNDDVYIGVIIRDALEECNFVFPDASYLRNFAIDFRPPRSENPIGHVYDGTNIKIISKADLKYYRPFGVHGLYLREEDLPCH